MIYIYIYINVGCYVVADACTFIREIAVTSYPPCVHACTQSRSYIFICCCVGELCMSGLEIEFKVLGNNSVST